MSAASSHYVEAFLARNLVPGEAGVDVPGLHGAPPSSGRPDVRLLVTDDRAHDALAALLPAIRSGQIAVLDDAARCTALVAATAGWLPSTATAMTHPDLSALPEARLVADLTLRPVRRLPQDGPDEISHRYNSKLEY